MKFVIPRAAKMGAMAALVALSLATILACATQGISRAEVKEMHSSQDRLPDYPDVWVSGADLEHLGEPESLVLGRLIAYCQAMVDADTNTMRSLVDEHMVFTHMSGRQQTLEEYLADVASGSLDYRSIGIDSPRIEINGEQATVSFTSVLEANAYGSIGTYRMPGKRYFEHRGGTWVQTNGPNAEMP